MANSELAWPMLQYAAFLDPDSIDIQIFTELFNVDKKALTEAIKIVESLSAMYVVRREGQQPVLTLHRLTQGIVRKFIKNPAHQASCMSKTTILLKLAESLNALCPTIDRDPKNWPQAKKLMPHIELVLTRLPETVIGSEIAELWTKVGRYAENIGGSYSKAVSCYEKALAMQQQRYPDQPHLEVAFALNNLGFIYTKLGGGGNFRKSTELLEQALAMWQILYLDQPYLEMAKCLNYLGIAYDEFGMIKDYRKSVALKKQALAMLQNLYGDQPRLEIAQCLNNIGLTRFNRRERLDLQEQALTMLQTLHGDQPHPDLAVFLNNVGISYKELGDVANIRKGLDLQEQALAMRQTLYGDQPHPEIAISLNSVGIGYEKLGGITNIRKGVDFQEQALIMYKTLYGDQPHPNIAIFLNNVGTAYQSLGGVENIRKGRALEEEALVMRKKLYPDQLSIKVTYSDHPSTYVTHSPKNTKAESSCQIS